MNLPAVKHLFSRPEGRSKLEIRLARSGILFMTPLFIGLILFFVVPVAKSFWFSLANVGVTPDGYQTAFQGIKSYITALKVHPDYLQTLVTALINMAKTTPFVIIFSFFMSSVLNQRFKGRTAFRLILFLPVIFLSAAMMTLDSADRLQGAMDGFGAYKDTFGGSSVSFTQQLSDYLAAANISESTVSVISGAVDGVYRVIELSGIQIVILLTGLQSISPSLYEAAKVEGGSAWENFWKITFPMVSPLILTCFVFTVIDSFTSFDNQVMQMIDDTAFKGNFDFSLSSAMGWIYFAVIAAILGVCTFILSRMVFYYDR
ncbi:MAG: sugar ABC transporter permease [Oscillospiraceae bacterium]|nr:sugar ABC transporter permease [Oscillospiraceae bacterium]